MAVHSSGRLSTNYREVEEEVEVLSDGVIPNANADVIEITDSEDHADIIDV